MKRIILWVVILLACAAAVLGVAYTLGYVQLPSQMTDNTTTAEEGVAATDPTTEMAVSTGSDASSPAAASSIIADAKVVPVLSADLSLSSSGIAVEIAIREGMVVTPGQLLLQLDTSDTLVAIAQAKANLMNVQARYDELQAGSLEEDIEAGQATLAAAQARLDRLKLSTENGDIAASEATVAQAQANLQQVLDGPSQEQLIEARANLFNARAELTRAQSAYNLVKWRNDLGATQESANLQTATNNYEAAQARIADLENGATQAEIASASAAVRQSQAQLNALRNSRPADIAVYEADVRNAQAQLDKLLRGTRPEQLAQAEANVAAAIASLQQQLVALSKLELRAPFTGTVASLDVALGEQVTQGTPVLRLADLEQLQLETEDLTELQVVYLQEGDRAEVIFDAIPDLTMTATVVRIRPYGENSSGDIVYRATLALPQIDPRLRWNMTAAVTFER
jgi:multidrug resistance efflux pump